MKSRQLFLILTLLILVGDLLFVGINYYTSQRTLRLSLARNGVNLKHAYDLTLSLVYENMLQLSAYISNQRQVQQLFREGKQAVSREGGGGGGAEADRIRRALYEEVSPGWLVLMEKYDARQLHFHLGPGSLSFLRVHRQEKFGDRMDGIRHIIVDSYRERRSKAGFEVGRVYAGLRGTTPVWAEGAAGERELVGVLEVGTSYQPVLKKIHTQTGVEMMVLLNHDLVHSTMWPESIKKRIVKLSDNSSCYVEASTDEIVGKILRNCERLEPYKDQLRTFRLRYEGREFAVTHFPLYDYHALTGKDKNQAGMVIMLMDISEELRAHQQQLQVNLLYALVAFIAVEVLLYVGIIFGSHTLRGVIRQQTVEIDQLKEYYKERSEKDGLTDLYNHRSFNERLQQEMHRSQRSLSPLCLLMCDIDDFKMINDRFGHVSGDRVLEGVASLIREEVRASDFAGRYGGEEFTVALLDLGLDEAEAIAQRLIGRIADYDCANLSGQRITASAGVAMWDGRQSLSSFINSADDALYRAKRKGKNRVERA